MPRPKVHDETLRVRLLERAGKLLSEEGPSAVSLRRLATDTGTSTSAVYSLFGGKPELMRAVYLEASQRFGRQLAAVRHTDDPVADLRRLGLAYREFAVANPHLYAVLFSRPMPEFEPDEAARQQSRTSFAPLIELVRAAVAAGKIVAEPMTVAMGLWAVVHGMVSLELERNLPEDPAAKYDQVVEAMLRGWTR